MRVWDNSKLLSAPAHREQDIIQLVCRFITPVFGGGVDPKKRDDVTAVRVPALRGQLRFWWRATSSLTSVAALRDDEAKLFGGVHGKQPQASALAIAVTRQPRSPRNVAVFVNGNGFKVVDSAGPGLAYGAFPLRSLDSAKIHDVLFEYSDSFEIEMRFPHGIRRDVERALWGLLHFGGLGGRTRRGFGALELVSARGFELPSIQDGWPTELPNEPSWPTLWGHKMSSRTFAEPTKALEVALNLLRDMRQGDLGRRPGQQPNRPGRSRWPEPDAIRALYKGRLRTEHETRLLKFDKYPRAAFGAPIIFHFKTSPGEVEPPDVTLVPMRDGKALSRMASPLLLRPHRGQDGLYHALAVKLAHSEEGWALLERKVLKVARIERKLTQKEADQIDALKGFSSDPVEAYLARLSQL